MDRCIIMTGSDSKGKLMTTCDNCIMNKFTFLDWNGRVHVLFAKGLTYIGHGKLENDLEIGKWT